MELLKTAGLTAFFLILFHYLLWRFRSLQLTGFKPRVTIALFYVKFLAGLFIWAIYTFYYKDTANNDIHKFYQDAIVLQETAYTHPRQFIGLMTGINSLAPDATALTAPMKNWVRNFDESPFNENQTIIKLNALILFFSFKTYFVHILFLCFLSLIGLVRLTNSILKNASDAQRLLALITLLLPSVLLWNSGVMKEPLLAFGLGIFVPALINYRWTVKSTFIVLTGAALLLYTKFFVLVCLLPGALFYLTSAKGETGGKTWLKFTGVHVALLLLAFNIQHVLPAINPAQMLVHKQKNSVKEAIYFNAGSRVDIAPLESSFTSFCSNAPAALFRVFLRPFIGESRNPMMLASALENILILALLLYCFVRFGRNPGFELRLLLFLTSAGIAYFVLIGLCTPVLGNLVRYKIALLPLFLQGMITATRPCDTPEFLNKIASRYLILPAAENGKQHTNPEHICQ